MLLLMAALHLLMIDDDEQDRLLVTQVLAEYGPRVTLTTRGEAATALTLLRDSSQAAPQVILLDLQLPGVGGLELLDILKADTELVHIPVVILSSSDRPDHIREAYARHASSYIVKGKGYDDLRRQLTTFLQFWNVVTPPPSRDQRLS